MTKNMPLFAFEKFEQSSQPSNHIQNLYYYTKPNYVFSSTRHFIKHMKNLKVNGWVKSAR
jgi:hypothetical protein